MNILILGGIGEAVKLARALAATHSIIYSLAGKGRQPELPCQIRRGGFGGWQGLEIFLRDNAIDLLIDATHPFAAQMSHHAAQAAQRTEVPLWAYRRPAWQPTLGSDWRFVTDWAGIQSTLGEFQRPFFTIGLEPLQHTTEIPANQHWLVRCLAADVPMTSRLTLLCATGPFSLEQELALLREHHIDVLVAKNSGGHAVEAKLAAVQQMQIPVIMLDRPVLPPVNREFETVKSLLDAL